MDWSNATGLIAHASGSTIHISDAALELASSMQCSQDIPIQSIAFSADGLHLAAVDVNNGFSIWQRSATALNRWSEMFKSALVIQAEGIDFENQDSSYISPDGKLVASCWISRDEIANVWCGIWDDGVVYSMVAPVVANNLSYLEYMSVGLSSRTIVPRSEEFRIVKADLALDSANREVLAVWRQRIPRVHDSDPLPRSNGSGNASAELFIRDRDTIDWTPLYQAFLPDQLASIRTIRVLGNFQGKPINYSKYYTLPHIEPVFKLLIGTEHAISLYSVREKRGVMLSDAFYKLEGANKEVLQNDLTGTEEGEIVFDQISVMKLELEDSLIDVLVANPGFTLDTIQEMPAFSVVVQSQGKKAKKDEGLQVHARFLDQMLRAFAATPATVLPMGTGIEQDISSGLDQGIRRASPGESKRNHLGSSVKPTLLLLQSPPRTLFAAVTASTASYTLLARGLGHRSGKDKLQFLEDFLSYLANLDASASGEEGDVKPAAAKTSALQTRFLQTIVTMQAVLFKNDASRCRMATNLLTLIQLVRLFRCSRRVSRSQIPQESFDSSNYWNILGHLTWFFGILKEVIHAFTSSTSTKGPDTPMLCFYFMHPFPRSLIERILRSTFSFTTYVIQSTISAETTIEYHLELLRNALTDLTQDNRDSTAALNSLIVGNEWKQRVQQAYASSSGKDLVVASLLDYTVPSEGLFDQLRNDISNLFSQIPTQASRKRKRDEETLDCVTRGMLPMLQDERTDIQRQKPTKRCMICKGITIVMEQSSSSDQENASLLASAGAADFDMGDTALELSSWEGHALNGCTRCGGSWWRM